MESRRNWRLYLNNLRRRQVGKVQEKVRWLMMEKDEEFRKMITKSIADIEEAQDNFSVDLRLAENTICEFSRIIPELEDKAQNLLKTTSKINSVQVRQWESKETMWRLWSEWKNGMGSVNSMYQLSSLIRGTIVKFLQLKPIERCHMYITPLGQIRMCPSAHKTTVEVKSVYQLNKMNTVKVTVKDWLDRVVDGDVNYDLSAIVIDNEVNAVYVTIENERNGVYNINFFPTSTVKHTLFVTVNSILVQGKSFPLHVVDNSYGMSSPKVIGQAGSHPGDLSRPWGVCCDTYGWIYVSDRCNHRVQVFTEEGDFIFGFGKEGNGPGEFNRPAGIVVDPLERVIVADKNNNRIQILKCNGEYVTHFGKESLKHPWDVAVKLIDSVCYIAVTEGNDHRVTLFTDRGDRQAVCVFSPENKLSYPRGITSVNGTFLVTDFEEHKIVVLDQDFQAVATLGSKGVGVDQFFRPQGIASSCDGETFAVSDCKNNRIMIYKRDRPVKMITDDFDTLQGIAFHPNGFLLVVVDSINCNVKIFDLRDTDPSDLANF